MSAPHITIEELNEIFPDEPCSSCKIAAGKVNHTCPYKEAVYEDKNTLCNCCSICEDVCSMAIYEMP